MKTLIYNKSGKFNEKNFIILLAGVFFIFILISSINSTLGDYLNRNITISSTCATTDTPFTVTNNNSNFWINPDSIGQKICRYNYGNNKS